MRVPAKNVNFIKNFKNNFFRLIIKHLRKIFKILLRFCNFSTIFAINKIIDVIFIYSY